MRKESSNRTSIISHNAPRLRMMNSRERIIKAINHEMPDRVPLDGDFNPIIWEKLRSYFGIEDDERIKEELGLDFKKGKMNPPASFQKQAFIDPSGEEGYVLPLNNDVFEAEWGFRYKIKFGVPYYIYHPLGDVSDFDKYEFPDISAPGRFDELEKIIATYKDKYVIVGFIPWNFFKHAWQLRGFQNVLQDLYLNPEFVEKLLDRLLDFKIKQVKKYVEFGVDIIGIAGDIGMQETMIMAPDIWRKFFKPRLRILIEESTKRRKDIYWFFHSDGYIKPVIPDLIEIGFNIINPIQPESMDPVGIKKMYGDKITLHGTISLQRTLPFGTPEDVKKEVLSRIEKCGYYGGLVLAPANLVTPDVPIENVLALYGTAKGTRCR